MDQPNAWQAVLDFWFGPDNQPSQEAIKRWFSGGKEIDSLIRTHFLPIHTKLTNGSADFSPTSPEETLAAIIVIDQFSRNLYRNSPDAFKWDSLAIEWSLQGWSSGLFSQLPVSHQAFSIMPLVHSEDIELHEKALTLFTQLNTKPSNPDTILTGFYSSALEHHDIIKRFGRYPHRNKTLGRASTDAETNYLNTGANRFGQ